MAMMQVVSVIESVIKAMKSFIDKLENMSKSLVQTLQEYSTQAAGKIRTQMINIFNSVERHIKNEITALTTRLEALRSGLKKSKLKSGTSTMHKLEAYVKDAVKDIENISEKFMAKVKTCVEKFGKALEMISQSGEKLISESFTDAEKFAGDVVKKIEEVGKDSVDGIKTAIEPVLGEFSHIESFVYKHGVQMAEAAAVSFLDPFMFISFFIAGGAIIAASNYTPK